MKTQEIPRVFFFAGSEKKLFDCTLAKACTVQLLSYDTYCPITQSC